MKVTLREKPINGGRKSLYLDFYPPIPHPETGKPTRREFLGLYLFDKPRLELDRKHNKETRVLGETICAQRQLSVQSGHYGFLSKAAADVDFLAWFKAQAETEKLKPSFNGRLTWMSTYQHLNKFAKGRLMADQVTEDFCRKFLTYLITTKTITPKRAEPIRLSHNSAASYYSLFKAGVKRAFEAKLLTTNPAERVKRISMKERQREFLTLSELRTLAVTECEREDLKRAALFSALTGLRFSDIVTLTWGEVHSDEANHTLRFTQQKTNHVETLPISETAFSLLGDKRVSSERVFPDLVYSTRQTKKLQEWCQRAGVDRYITFHVFRHTFATLQLSMGTDLYTISKMLGHRSISTTQIYAKVVDKAKREAADKIKLTF